jgi:hypothetical protein
VHVINNEHVQDVLQQLQIYKKGFTPEDPDVCFVESIKDQVPADTLLQK